MEEFAPLDTLLMLTGCRIQNQNRGFRIANLIFLLVMLLSYIGTAVVHTCIDRMADEPLIFLSLAADTIFGIAFVTVMNVMRSQFEGILTTSSFLTESQRRKLKKHSIISAVILILYFTQAGVLTTIHVWGHSLQHVAIDLCSSYITLNSWFIGGSCVYTYFVKLIRCREERYFTRLVTALSAGKVNETEMLDLMLERRDVTEFKRKILQAFSLIPCAWFAFIFLTMAMVYELLESSELVTLIVMRLVEMLLLVSTIAYVISLCESVTVYTKQMTTKVITNLMRSGRMGEMADLVTELKESSGFQFTVWSMFDMNRRYALSFLSSLITFTVLFIQIGSAWKRLH